LFEQTEYLNKYSFIEAYGIEKHQLIEKHAMVIE